MEPIPLIPALNSLSCPDTSQILREEFQEYLGNQKFPEKIAENLHEFNSNELQLKTCGTEIAICCNEMKVKTNELTHAEKLVMTAQAEFLIHEHDPKTDGAKFKLQKIYPDLDEEIVEKYSLLQADDIMPHITERIINCKMKPHEFLFKNACLETKRNIKKSAKMECLGTCKKGQKCPLKFSPSQESKLAKFEHYNSRRNEIKKNARRKYNYTKKSVFVAEPNELVFSNYEKNIVYEQNLRLRNITSIPQTFKYPVLSENSKFSVKQHGDKFKIAPGISVQFTVSFTTDNLSDSFDDVLVFHIPGSQSIYVSLICWRTVPIMKGLMYQEDEGLFEEIKSPKEKDEVYNFTIDCGAVLYGSSKEIKFVVQNSGGHGVFFLLSEDDWVQGEVNNITEDFKLKLLDFTLSPAYFELKENEVNEIVINFAPTQYGLCLDKIFLLCDTNTVEEIDIIGDCLFYEHYFLKFEMPECPFNPYKQSSKPKNVLHLGAIYSKQTISGSFTIHNISMLSFSFEWRKNKYSRVQNFIPIENDCINIYPSEGSFPPASETVFEVTVRMNKNSFGLYKFAYSLYVLDIMEKNLTEGPLFTFGEEYRNEIFEKCLTIQVDKLEVQIHHIPLQIQIYPEEIKFPTLFYNVNSCKKTVRVKNNGFCCMLCQWIYNQSCGCQPGNENKVEINPAKFELHPNSFVDCSVSLVPASYDDIHETFVLSINNAYAALTLPLHAAVTKPHIRVSPSFLDMGSLVKRGSDVRTELHVENTSDAPLYWRVHEYRFEFDTHRFVDVCSCRLNADCGLLCHKGSWARLEYRLDTEIAQRFMSVLVFYTIYNKSLYESSHVIIVANILQPVVSILSEAYQEEVFSVREEYFVKETTTRCFNIHNDSPLEVAYSWGEPSGVHSSMVSLSFPSWSGRLFPWSRRCVQASVTFLQPGVVLDVYVPLGVEALPPDPQAALALHVCCRVKPPQVLFSFPVDPDCRTARHVDVLWPIYHSVRCSAVTVDEEDELKMEEYNPCPEGESIERKYTVINLMNNEPDDTSNLSRYPSDLFTYLENITLPAEEEYHYPSEATLTPPEDVNTAEVPSYRKSCEHLTSIFGTNTSICEYFIEFRDVPCRQLCKKSIEITNIMDVLTNFSVTVKNFKNKIMNRKKLDDILININWKADDKYTQQLSEYGIVVIVDPETSDLKNKSTVYIELQVYAETWGYYLEEICIEVEDLPRFYINVFVQVSGLPIEFPVSANNSDLSECTVRFGCHSVCSPVETRSVFFTNNCTIPYTVVWHIFVKNFEDYLKGSINIAYDIFGFDSKNESTKLKLRIMNYFGKEISREFNVFKIEPHAIYIKPKETKSVRISLNPEYFRNNFDVVNIEAVLIGNIYIEDQYQIITNESNFVLRHPENELAPININLIGSIEPGTLDLNCVTGEPDMKGAVSEFLRDSDIVLVQTRLVFRNTANYTVVIGMRTEEPFSIISIKSNANECTEADSNNMYTSVVHADCCAEVLVQCLISTDMLMMMADILYTDIAHFLPDTAFSKNNQVKVTKTLHIFQKCVAQQQIRLSLILVFPLTVVSQEVLNFNQVRLGTEKKMTLKIHNKTAYQTWFHANVVDSDIVFQVKPTKGYLNAVQLETYSTFLTVTFAPKDIRDYEETLIVVTCLSQYRQEVKLLGTGTYNEKYLCEMSFN